MKKEFLKKKWIIKDWKWISSSWNEFIERIERPKSKLEGLQTDLNDLLDKIEKDIDNNKKLTKKDFNEIRILVKKLLLSRRICRKIW